MAPTAPWCLNAYVDFLNHHRAPAVSYATGGAGYLRWLVAGFVFLGAASLGIFGYYIFAASKTLTWQFALAASTWFLSTITVYHFLHFLPQGELVFDGENWYFVNITEPVEQLGMVSIRFDAQNGMLLRFESEFKRVSWLWLEVGSEPYRWHDLRRAEYSRPAIQNLHDLI